MKVRFSKSNQLDYHFDRVNGCKDLIKYLEDCDYFSVHAIPGGGQDDCVKANTDKYENVKSWMLHKLCEEISYFIARCDDF